MAESQPPNEEKGPDDVVVEKPEEYTTGAALVALVGSLMLGMFLVALDNTILSTAIPKITDQFKDLSKVSWYGAAYFMTFGGFQSTWGKLYKYFHIKIWYLVAMVIFEVGSLVCAVAQDPTTLIVGRAIAGLGGSGVTVGLFTIIGFAASPEKRPQFLGMIGAVYAIAAVLGPLIGGAFTEKVSWRWCFYINLPIGGLGVVITMFFFKLPSTAKPVAASFKEKFLQLDLVGAALMMALLISYILALQYGGQTYPWNSSVVIGLLVGFVAILAVFVVWELYQKEYAMIVPRLTSRKEHYLPSGSYFVLLYYLPIYFQSVDNASPIGSGVRMLALIIPLTFAAIAQGFAYTNIGITPLFWTVGGTLGTIGCGLLYTMDESTPTGKWIGYQILVGVAVGFTTQVALQNAQVQCRPEDLSQATAVINFFLTLGGSLFISAAQCAFNNELIKYIAANLPGIDPAIALGTGATEIRKAFPAEQVPIVIDAYVAGLKNVFIIAIAAFSAATVVGFLGDWKRLDAEKIKKAAGGAA
ncbi:hypothetical protein PRZ48_000668 [Zasmidium cellare]|uniref:Major facilitator superfamily (MFS) profile domain-containing protein n=1 Tax=Zasmidium cellare TaxID=395010 RepID=A0ABR0F0G9_ZASCE|nr:hypothetical protein PRZ48_000668 [Zasmidium cellare]